MESDGAAVDAPLWRPSRHPDLDGTFGRYVPAADRRVCPVCGSDWWAGRRPARVAHLLEVHVYARHQEPLDAPPAGG